MIGDQGESCTNASDCYSFDGRHGGHNSSCCCYCGGRLVKRSTLRRLGSKRDMLGPMNDSV